ncbi:MAG TPA: hypothetical protein VGL66_04920 [Caulobacteraceae bacterium]
MRRGGPTAKRAHCGQSPEPSTMHALIAIGIFLIVVGLFNWLEFGRLD